MRSNTSVLKYLAQVERRAKNLTDNKYDREDLVSNVAIQLLSKDMTRVSKPANYINRTVSRQWLAMNRTPGGKRGKYNYFQPPTVSVYSVGKMENHTGSECDPWDTVGDGVLVRYDLDYWIDKQRELLCQATHTRCGRCNYEAV